MTLTDYRNFDKTVMEIKEYRNKRLKAKKEKLSLREFDYSIHLKVFTDLYKDIIEAGNIKTRETETTTSEEYMKKKINNWGDYTDLFLEFCVLPSWWSLLKDGHCLLVLHERKR